MPSQSQYVDSKFLFPHTYREGNKCIGLAKSRGQLCNNTISQRKHATHLSLMEQLNQLSLAEQITSPLLVQAVELRLCSKHLKNNLATELEKAQRKLTIVMGDAEEQRAAQDQPARTHGRLPRSTDLASRARAEDAFTNVRKTPPTRVSTVYPPAARTPRVHFTPSTRGPAGEPSAGHTPSPRPAAARHAAPARDPAVRPPAVNDYTSRAHAPAIRPQQIRVAEARVPPPAPLPPHLAFRFWEHTPEYGNPLGGRSHRWARAEPLTPPTGLPSPRDDTPDSDVTVGRYTNMNTAAATNYIPSDSESESSSDDSYDDSSEDEGPENANSRTYPMRFWHRYDKKWDSLEDNGRVKGKALEEQIPWPVYGKNYPTPENVEAFYRDAVVGFSARSDRVLVIGNECRRWAPKNLKKVLGKRIFKGMFAETLQMIYSVARGYHDRLISETGGLDMFLDGDNIDKCVLFGRDTEEAK
ncbi:hypothetical protein CEP54_006329 [Fusarium duplospermum]|uniref:Uncharacterized protein n=1 Tax=Fusarium duplospermum TaxID=1325734 RepID=A0A428Q7N6_9HYPO|nr:hypothetical protein CEP54_006329 [Fusarium duplospermum]